MQTHVRVPSLAAGCVLAALAITSPLDAQATPASLRGIVRTPEGAPVAMASVFILEVPRSYEDLIALMAGFPVFGASFAVLLMIWHSHVVFFRRYGLQDFLTIVLNAALLFLVVVYIYPLKFLFTLVISGVLGIGRASAPRLTIGREQAVTLMVIYALCLASVLFVLGLMNLHARRKRPALDLDAREVHLTRMTVQYCGIWIAISLLVIAIAMIGGLCWIWLAGVTFGLLGPVQFAHGYWMGKRAPEREDPPPSAVPARAPALSEEPAG